MKLTIKLFVVFLFLGTLLFFLHFNNLRNTNSEVVEYYSLLKSNLEEKGYKSNLLVVCTNRSKVENFFYQKISVAASKSQHLKDKAIDILVFDVNGDGSINSKDVDMVYDLLDKEIIKDFGGVGTYKNQGSFIKQMIHIDCRGTKARWNY